MTTKKATEPKKQENLVRLIKSRTWRLNNLYHIRPKEGSSLIPFRLNWAQTELYNNIWNRVIVLKARQLGVTTFFSVLFLDDCLFNPNREAGIIADTRENAEAIFRTKVKDVFDNVAKDIPALKDLIHSTIQLESEQGKRLIFSNGSAFRVSTSMRSGTLSQLLITEYGKICAKEPEKAREVRTGSIETLPRDALLAIESTAMGNEGDFFVKCRDSELDTLSRKELTTMDYRFFFFPWFKEKAYSLETTAQVPPDIESYFKKQEELLKIKFTNAQKAWYAKKNAELGEDVKREYPTTAKEAFEQSIEGAYLARHLQNAYKDNRVDTIPYIRRLPVHTCWDLGINDTTCIWFFQLHQDCVRFIDYYENADEGLTHYVNLLKQRDYIYGKHLAPHDIEVRDFTIGKTRKEFAREQGLIFHTVPRPNDVMDKIESVRNVFPQLYFDENKCSRGLTCLKNYRKEWDDKNGCYKNRPLHNWASHGFDALATGTLGFEAGFLDATPLQEKAVAGYDVFQ